jgi:hypothetical protein
VNTVSNELTQPTGITTWKALPDDFELQIHLDKNDCPYTEAFSLTVEAQKSLTGVTVFNWTRTAGEQICEMFHRHTHIARDKLRVCSDYSPDGCWLVWIKSMVPMPRIALAYNEQQRIREDYCREDSKVTAKLHKELKKLPRGLDDPIIDI